jgi:fermentation-respiration switch protein FrsA (DUF1100 family)
MQLEDECPMTRQKRRLRRIAIGVVCLYVALCIIMFSIQDWMIFAGRSTQGTAEAIVRPSTEYELLHLKTADGDPFVAIFGFAIDGLDQPVTDSVSRPTILFFYGNAMSLSGCFDMFREFRRLGANVMIVEYPGYGMSGGKASERSLYAAADAAFDYLAHRPDVDGGKIVAAGWSLGAAVATDLAAHRPVAALATFSAFTSMSDMARLRAFFLPTSLLLRSRFDNESKIRQIACPIFNAHGIHDSIVPLAMSKRLIAAAKGPVTSVEVDSDHNDIFESGGAELDERFKQFLGQLK